MVITTSEVVARYVFNHPTAYAWPLNRQLFGLFILAAGIYNIAKGGHIRIEILYDVLPQKVRAVARLIAFLCFGAFIVVLVWQGTWMGWNSASMLEKAPGAFRIPLYPFKLILPLAAFWFFLQGLCNFLRGRE
jgi:TRAP-type mannitol/chloroaromatic compound transport system permease small subunit